MNRAATFALTALLVGSLRAAAVDTITVNATNVLNDTTRHPIGINTEYWWDDQANRGPGARPLDAALRDMGMKFLRYPGGEKSDGYLWSLPPFTNSQPTLARIGPDDWPSNDPAYLNPNGTWAHPVYDFDAFMATCRAAGGEPVLVVAYDGIFKAATHGGTSLTRQEAIDTAVGWVRYANVTKGYNVKYWEIGNECWLSGYMGTSPGSAQYATDVAVFSQAMKAVDPTIKIGATGNNSTWFRDILQTAATNVDFLVVHAYPCYGWKNYGIYRGSTPDLGIVTTAATALTNYAPAHVGRIKIAMTETAAATWSSWTANDLGHALPAFDIFGQLLADSRVEFAQFWNTRWINNATASPPEVWDALGHTNQLLPAGRALAIWGQFLLDRMVAANSSSSLVRSWAAHGPTARKLNLFLVNKDTADRAVGVNLQNYTNAVTAARWVFSGTGDADLNPVWTQTNGISVVSNQLSLTLPAVSITVLELAPANSPPSLAPVANQTVHFGATLTLTNLATDPDAPPQLLTFTLDAAPPGATLGPANGVFAWASTNAAPGTTNAVAIRVTDNGTPPLSAARAFTIEVVSPPTLAVDRALPGEVTLTWTAIPGRTYRVQSRPELGSGNWTDLPGDVIATNTTASKLDVPPDTDAQRFYRILLLP